MVEVIKYTQGNNPNSIKNRFIKGISHSSYWWKKEDAKNIAKKISEGQKKNWRKKHELYGSFQKGYCCKNCGKKFNKWLYKKAKESYSNKFCSRKCSATYQCKLNAKWPKIITKEIFEESYYKKKMSLREISKKFKCNIATISHLRKRYSIKKRNYNKAVSLGIQKNIEKFREASRGSKNSMYGKISFPKARFIPELGHSVRSSWEKDIAFALKKENIPYKYEGITFKINSGQNTYTPDFIIKNIALEVKGWLFDKSKNKMIRFMKECPYKLWIVASNKDRFNFSFADKVFKVFYYKWEKGKNATKINQKELNRLINEIRKNL